jgi:uncharacterized membrane protein
MQIVVLTILCALFYALFEIFADLAGGRVNQWLAAALYNGVGTLIPLVIYFATAKGKTTHRGLIYAGLAGICIMFFSVILARLFNKHGSLDFVIPVVYGLAIVLSSAFGWLYLKEKMSGLHALGLAFVVLGVSLIVAAKLRTA